MSPRQDLDAETSSSTYATRRAPQRRAVEVSYPLTAQIAAGSEPAFAVFYDLWFPRLLALARGSTRRDHTFCLDVVQDCMLRVVRKLPALDSEEAVAAWLVRALLRAAVDHMRSEARRQRRERSHAANAPLSCDDALPDLLDAEQRAWLCARLAELPKADRELLAARAAGATLDAAGATAGISGDAAHGRLRRLITRLRAAARNLFGD